MAQAPHNSQPSGPQGHAIFGNFSAFARNPPQFLTQQVRDFGGITHFRLLFKSVYLVSDPELVRRVLVTDAKSYIKGPLGVKVIKRGLGEGLITSEGEQHSKQRKLVQPAFQHKRIQSYGEIIAQHTEKLLAQWQSGETREIDRDMHRLTMAIVTEALFSTQLSEDDYSVGRAVSKLQTLAMQSLVSIVPLPFWVPTPNHLTVRYQRRALDKVIHKIIRQRVKDGVDRGDLLSALLFSDDNNQQSMTKQQLRDETVTLFAAGHETTANALTWTFLFLTEHPTIQKRLQEEVDQVLQGRPVRAEDIDKLPFAGAVFKESLRLRPTVWLLNARLACQETLLGDYPIAQDSLLLLSPYAMHRNPAYFDHPDQFDPDRWLDGRTDNLPRLAYMPFGAGARVCIGNQFAILEALMVITSIAQRFQIEGNEAQRAVKARALITLTPDRPVHLRVVRREQR